MSEFTKADGIPYYRMKVLFLEQEVEQLRVQLAGCGVAAMQNTEATIRDRAVDGDYGYSAAYSDVCRAVDREICYREALKRIVHTKWTAEKDLLQVIFLKDIAKEALEI